MKEKNSMTLGDKQIDIILGINKGITIDNHHFRKPYQDGYQAFPLKSKREQSKSK